MKYLCLAIFLGSISTSLPQQDIMDMNQFVMAEAYEQQGEYAKALDVVYSLYEKNPENPNFFSKLNNLFLLTKNYDSSIVLINKRIAIYPEDPNLYGMLGSTYYIIGDQKKAKEIWEIPLIKSPDNYINYRIVANYALDRRAFETAISFFERGKEVSPDPGIFSLDLGELYALTMRYKEAAKEYCELIKSKPSLYPNVENRIFTYVNKPNALSETISVVEGYIQADEFSFKELLAKLYLEGKDFDKAFELYKELDKIKLAEGRTLINFANFLFKESKLQLAEEVYGYVIEEYPNSKTLADARLGYTKTLEALLIQDFKEKNPDWKTFYSTIALDDNRVTPVLKSYGELIELYKNSEVAVESYYRSGLIVLYLQNKNLEAEKLFKEITGKYVTSHFGDKAFIELGNIALINGDLNLAEQNYLSAVKYGRNDEYEKSFAFYQLGRTSSFKGDYKAALEYLIKVSANPKDDYTNDALQFALILNTGKNDSSNLVSYCKAEFLTEQKKFAEAKEIYDNIASNPQAFVFNSICKIRSAEMDIALNEYSEALIKLGVIVEESDKNIYSDKALYLIGKVYEFGLSDFPNALDSFQKLLASYPNSIYLDDARERILILREKIKQGKSDV